MKAIKLDDTGSVLIDTNEGFNLWVDVWQEGNELQADWNQYIFHLTDENDMKVKTFQENDDNVSECFNLALNYYEENFNTTLR